MISRFQHVLAAEKLPRGLISIILICCLVEGALQLADWGIITPARLRNIAYENGAFWAGLLRAWTPNYTAQPYLMFLTYGFLHGGFLHLLMNMITLWSLGIAVIDRVGPHKFSMLYAACLIGGALGYALLAQTPAPMVGASGALFGLAGALLAWAYIDRFTLKETLWPIIQAATLLIAINIAMYWALDGHLAWQTHLAGAITGWISASIIDPTPRK